MTARRGGTDLKNVYIGDADLSGEFDTTDFVQVFVSGKYETQQSALWEEGDWNADLQFDTGDFVAAFVDGGYEKGPRSQGAVNVVPEPSAMGLGLSAVGPLVLNRRRRRRKRTVARRSL